MLDALGIVDEVIRQGLISARFQHWDRVTSKLVAEFDYGLLKDDTPYPYAVQCESHKLVAIAEAKLAALPNATVQRRHEVTGMEVRAHGVRAQCATPDGAAVVDADYLVGTDGARSLVRKTIGVEFEGYTFPERFVGLTTPFDFEREYGYSNRNYFADPEQFVMLFKVAGNDMRGIWRVISPTEVDEPDEAVLSDGAVQARVQHFFPQAEPYEIRYRGLYRFHQRSRRPSAKPAFSSPATRRTSTIPPAVGMNSGIHDGMELAELLAAVARAPTPRTRPLRPPAASAQRRVRPGADGRQ